MTAPEESCTLPKMLPVFCAIAGRAARIVTIANRAKRSIRDVRRGDVLQSAAPLRNGPRNLMRIMPYSILGQYWSDHNNRGKYAFLYIHLSSISYRMSLKAGIGQRRRG
jgi:hypothetical protein